MGKHRLIQLFQPLTFRLLDLSKATLATPALA
jgi:hypothetical protein